MPVELLTYFYREFQRREHITSIIRDVLVGNHAMDRHVLLAVFDAKRETGRFQGMPDVCQCERHRSEIQESVGTSHPLALLTAAGEPDERALTVAMLDADIREIRVRLTLTGLSIRVLHHFKRKPVVIPRATRAPLGGEA
jgi:hypothetical protein